MQLNRHLTSYFDLKTILEFFELMIGTIYPFYSRDRRGTQLTLFSSQITRRASALGPLTALCPKATPSPSARGGPPSARRFWTIRGSLFPLGRRTPLLSLRRRLSTKSTFTDAKMRGLRWVCLLFVSEVRSGTSQGFWCALGLLTRRVLERLWLTTEGFYSS